MINSNQPYVTCAEFMELAIRFEAESAKFYRELRDRAADAQVQEVLALLAQEELKHLKTLQAYDISAYQTGVLQFPPALIASMPELPASPPNVSECLEIGLVRERKSVEMYAQAAALVSGDFQQLLTGLANFEQQHVEKLLSLQQLF